MTYSLCPHQETYMISKELGGLEKEKFHFALLIVITQNRTDNGHLISFHKKTSTT